MNKINEIIACTLGFEGLNEQNTYEEEGTLLFRFNSTEEDLDSLEELLKDF